MKKIILSSFLAAAIFATGCLKDKDSGIQYGIEDVEVKGVAFAKRSVAAGLTADATPQAISPVIITANSNTAPTSDVNYTVTYTPALIPANLNLTALPASAITFASSGVIKAGNYTDTLDISLLDASALDPNVKYGVAFTITTSDGGYIIAENSKTVVVSISIKNKYDGNYSLDGIHLRPPYNAFPFKDVEMDLITTGPNSVAFYFVDWGDFAHPIGTSATAVGSYGNAIAPEFTFDPATNQVISIANVTPGVALFLGPDPGRWDPVTKTIYVQWYYTTGAGQNFSNRGWSDTLTYVGPR